MGKKHDELMAEIKLVHQEIFDLRCEIDQIENLLSSVRTIVGRLNAPVYYPVYVPQLLFPQYPHYNPEITWTHTDSGTNQG
jgi:hypothetical protein